MFLAEITACPLLAESTRLQADTSEFEKSEKVDKTLKRHKEDKIFLE